jgi:Fe2+ or Zn2+ uptake regulation protein
MKHCESEILLQDKKIKVTKQRVTVLDLIISKDSSFCANDLFDELKGQLDLVTIYRNLQLLCDEKILREVMNKEDRQYFELACVHNPVHPHFYCSSCKKIFCIKSKINYTVPKKINPDENFIIHETVLQYSGICPDCQF